MYYQKFFGIFNRFRRIDGTGRRKRNRHSLSSRSTRSSSVEQLEPRIALSVNPAYIEAAGDRANGWVVLALDANQDEVYLRTTQEIDSSGDVNERVEFADNPGFVNPSSFIHSENVYQDVLVTNGTLVTYDSFTEEGDTRSGDAVNFPLPDATHSSVTPGDWSVPTALNKYNVVPGALSGILSVEHEGQTRFITFAAGALYGVDDGGGDHDVNLVFGTGRTNIGTIGPFNVVGEPGEDGEAEVTQVDIEVTGVLDYFGQLRFEFALTGGDDAESTPFDGPTGGSSVLASYYTPIIPEGPSAVTLAAGRDFHLGLQADLPGPDSTVQIASPMLFNVGTTRTNDVVLAATTVRIDSPVTSNGSFLVTPTSSELSSLIPVGGSRETVVEEFRTITGISAVDIGVSVADDPRTTVRERGAAIIEPSGSWTSTSGSLSVRAVKSDLSFAGDVDAANQSYLFRTHVPVVDPNNEPASEEVPYKFETHANGRLSATTLDITLDNGLDFSSEETVIHTVDFQTNANSLRISAERDNTPASSDHSSAFDIAVQAQDNINIDAVVATGSTFSVNGSQGVTLNSSIRSLGDVVITAAGNISGLADITTDDGAIEIEANDVVLNGSLQVLKASYGEIQDDISVTAVAGGIKLEDSLSAGNTVKLTQEGDGEIFVRELFATKLSVASTGDVNLPLIDVDNGIIRSASGGVSLEEVGDAQFEISAPGPTSLVVGGVDTETAPALQATIEGTGSLVVSAPRGSIELVANTANMLELGNKAELAAFQGVPTLAAGSVRVRSTQGQMRVLDAPVAGFGELVARAATAQNLEGIYLLNNPGEIPSTLTSATNGSIQAVPGFSTIFPGMVDNPLQVRDLLLLRSQVDPTQNGLYQIMSVGSPTTPWQLVRAPNADETHELREGARVAILDGGFRRQSFQVAGYNNVREVTPLSVTAGKSRSSEEIHVRAATDVRLPGTHDGFGKIDLSLSSPEFSVAGVTINDGDLVLVRFGVEDDPTADGLHASAATNGIYQASLVNDEWSLNRWTPFGALEPATESIVVVDDGIDRTAVTGHTYTVAYDGLGRAELSFNQAETLPIEIGSFDPRDRVEFVVATRGGTNSSPGSLGRMVSLIQSNKAQDFNGESVEQSIRFSNVLGGPGQGEGEEDQYSGVIELQQALPEFEVPFALSTTDRYPLIPSPDLPNQATQVEIVIDGSRITSTREGSFVTSQHDGELHGFVIKAGASGETRTTSPEDASRSFIQGVRMIGFEKGAAIHVDGASNYLIRDVIVGRDIDDNSVAVQYGVLVGEGSGVDGPVTILNSSFYSASVSTGDISNPLQGAGIAIESQGGAFASADYVQVIGGEIGSINHSNFVGISVDSASDVSANIADLNSLEGISIGTNPVLAPLVLSTVQNKAVLAIESSLWGQYGRDIFLGQTVSGPGVLAGTEVAFIETGEDSNNNGALDPGEDRNGNNVLDEGLKLVTLSQALTSTDEEAPLSFGTQSASGARTNINFNFRGISLASGKTRVVNTTIDNNILDGVDLGIDQVTGGPLNVTLGDGRAESEFNRQAVSGLATTSTILFGDTLPVYEGMLVTDPENPTSAARIQDDTYVLSVNYTTNEVTLSKPLLADISAQDRIYFKGFNPKLRSVASNAILENGRYGILFRESVQAIATGATQITVQGNYLGKLHDDNINEPGNGRANYFANNVAFAGSAKFDVEDPVDPMSFYDRSHNFSSVETQFDFGDIDNNVNTESKVPLVNTMAPSDLDWSPGRQRVTLSWVPPDVNASTFNIRGYTIKVVEMQGDVEWETKQWSLINSSQISRYELTTFGRNGEFLQDGTEYRISIAAELVDKIGVAPPGFELDGFALSQFSNEVSAIPTQPASSPPRRPVARF